MYEIEDICNKYYKNVYKYLISLSHNPNIAEELTQDTFCIAIKKLINLKEIVKLLLGFVLLRNIYIINILKKLYMKILMI